jgi:hypothetical protein
MKYRPKAMAWKVLRELKRHFIGSCIEQNKKALPVGGIVADLEA